jgi:simple sugar transport system permease protein
VSYVEQGLRISVPYALAALGGTISERSGVINLALEGILLSGAFACAAAASVGGAGVGAIGGMAGGVLCAAIYLACVLRGANQIIAGIGVNLLAMGLTRYLLKLVFHSASSTPKLPGFASGAVEDVFMAGVALLVIATQVWLARTPGGLRLRAVGEEPAAADSLGVPILGTRIGAVLASGVLAGLGGAWLALDQHGFVDRMSGGRGYTALAAMIFGRWSPAYAALACLAFGFADAAQVQLQLHHVHAIPRELVQCIPPILTIAALAIALGGSRAPAALGKAWPT